MYKFVYIILNFKTYQYTIQLVNELTKCVNNDSLVLVVDNASPNESFKVLLHTFQDYTNVEIIQSNENGGFAKGNNFGLRYAEKFSPQYVCIINNDVHFDNELVDRLALIYEKLPDAGVIAPIQYLPSGQMARFRSLEYPTFIKDCLEYILWPSISKYHMYIDNFKTPGAQPVYIIPGAFMFTNYLNFKKMGFFCEETFLFGEERFVGAYAKKNGFQNYIILNETYLHEHGKTIQSEKSNRQKDKLIYEGRKLFARLIRKDNVIQLTILNICYHVYLLRMFILSKINKH